MLFSSATVKPGQLLSPYTTTSDQSQPPTVQHEGGQDVLQQVASPENGGSKETYLLHPLAPRKPHTAIDNAGSQRQSTPLEDDSQSPASLNLSSIDLNGSPLLPTDSSHFLPSNTNHPLPADTTCLLKANTTYTLPSSPAFKTAEVAPSFADRALTNPAACSTKHRSLIPLPGTKVCLLVDAEYVTKHDLCGHIISYTVHHFCGFQPAC